MTAEDQAWVQAQITAGLLRHDEAVRPLIVVNQEKIERNKKQTTGVCANLTNHEERIKAIEDQMA